MTDPSDTIRVLIPLKAHKKNGRPKILPPAEYRPSEDRAQDPHILRAISRAWGWRRRMEAGEFTTIQELAEAVGFAERHVSRQSRVAYLAPEVLKRLTCGREAPAVSIYDLCFPAGEACGEQVKRAVQDAWRRGHHTVSAMLSPNLRSWLGHRNTVRAVTPSG